MRLLATTILSVSLLGGVAYAQPKGGNPPAARPARGQAGGASPAPATPRVKNYDFDADFIDGELVRPEGEFLAARKTAEHGSLIKVRTDFIREIVKSAEDL